MRVTREEFEKAKKDCKEGWKKLAEDPLMPKKEAMPGYLHFFNCPACKIASKATGREPAKGCQLCPIDVYRRLGEGKNEKAICQLYGSYGPWYQASINADKNGMKSAAKKIARHRWTYLKEYKSE